MTRKSYELSNHLGNVYAVVTDKKMGIATTQYMTSVSYYKADVVSATDYFAFGAPENGRVFNSANYRYGFNGKENDPESVGTGEGLQDYGMRIYNPALGKFLSVDPLSIKFAWWSPYQFAGDKVINSIDMDGGEPQPVIEPPAPSTGRLLEWDDLFTGNGVITPCPNYRPYSSPVAGVFPVEAGYSGVTLQYDANGHATEAVYLSPGQVECMAKLKPAEPTPTPSGQYIGKVTINTSSSTTPSSLSPINAAAPFQNFHPLRPIVTDYAYLENNDLIEAKARIMRGEGTANDYLWMQEYNRRFGNGGVLPAYKSEMVKNSGGQLVESRIVNSNEALEQVFLYWVGQLTDVHQMEGKPGWYEGYMVDGTRTLIEYQPYGEKSTGEPGHVKVVVYDLPNGAHRVYQKWFVRYSEKETGQ